MATRMQPRPAAVKPPKRAKPTKAKAKAYLKQRGHRVDVVDGLALDSAAQIGAALLAVHGVTPAEYAAGKQ